MGPTILDLFCTALFLISILYFCVGQAGASDYITKPVDLAGFLDVVQSIDSFWLTVVKLPREARSQ